MSCSVCRSYINGRGALGNYTRLHTVGRVPVASVSYPLRIPNYGWRWWGWWFSQVRREKQSEKTWRCATPSLLCEAVRTPLAALLCIYPTVRVILLYLAGINTTNPKRLPPTFVKYVQSFKLQLKLLGDQSSSLYLIIYL